MTQEVKPGQTGVLIGGQKDSYIDMATGEDVVDDLENALTYDLFAEYRRLLGQGKVLLVSVGTSVRVLDSESERYLQVQVEDGERKGASGWIMRDRFRSRPIS
jgi:hypothetical protein